MSNESEKAPNIGLIYAMTFAVLGAVILLLFGVYNLGNRVSLAEQNIKTATTRYEKAEQAVGVCKGDLAISVDQSTGFERRMTTAEQQVALDAAKLAQLQQQVRTLTIRAVKAEAALKTCQAARVLIVETLKEDRQ